jgi:hypothetical protein
LVQKETLPRKAVKLILSSYSPFTISFGPISTCETPASVG